MSELKGRKLTASGVPWPVYDCVNRLLRDTDALKEEGILRTCGGKAKIDELAGVYDKKQRPNLDLEDATTVAGLLTMYFRTLPNCALTNGDSFYPHFVSIEKEIDVNEHPDKYYNCLSDLVHELPDVNRLSLEILFALLFEIQLYRESNKMDERNLAIW